MDDLISRQDAIDALAFFTEKSPTGRTAQEVVKALPSAQPERKTGKWIIVTDSRGRHAECPYCGEWKYHSSQKFCGECGALMKGEEE